MCGIVGITSKEPIAQRLIQGLERLEYRGYDSSGIAILDSDVIQIHRAPGKLDQLQALQEQFPIEGYIGIGHTRWATHGAPTAANAHPQRSRDVAVVHNGIIENFNDIKPRLIQKGYTFTSQTDTEVLAHLMDMYLNTGLTPLEAFRACLNEITGTYAISLIVRTHPDCIFIARRGSPLVIGYGTEEMTIGSDALVLAPWTQTVSYLEEGDYGYIDHTGATLFDAQHHPVERKQHTTQLTGATITKAGYPHYMLKEIYEQPQVLERNLSSYVTPDHTSTHFPMLTDFDWSSVTRLTIIACGTSYYAGMIAKYWFEKYAHLNVDVDIASEFRYRSPPWTKNGVALFISQSGETIDTLTALHLAKEHGQTTVAIVNVPESSMARQADHVILTKAGTEIGVASTKALTAQLTVLACLALQVAQKRDVLSDASSFIHSLKKLSASIQHILKQDAMLQNAATHLMSARSVLFMGRGTNYPVALEGALKLKELSYIHAEGYPAGELKHGPIALVDETMPIVVIAPYDSWFEKTLSNMQEVATRKGNLICVTDRQGRAQIAQHIPEAYILEIENCSEFVSPILYTIPLQLLAYYTALSLGRDVDQPRNLAKSVTVE